MKIFITLFSFLFIFSEVHHRKDVKMEVMHSYTIDSLGACQGASYHNKKLFLYGDREVGMIREYSITGDSLRYSGKEYKLTQNAVDIINHPTGIAYRAKGPVFIGNSIRLNKEGTLWKAVIYCVDWEGLLRTGTLDGNLLNTIEDDACMQGTRPEYVQYNNKWYVASADYGDKKNEVRLYDPALLQQAKKTSDESVLVKKFTCSPWVQNLHFIPEKNFLLLIQNQQEGRKWRFTFLDLKKSVESGREQVVRVVDVNNRTDELEGFTFLNTLRKGIAVSSSRNKNVNVMNISW